MHWLSTETIRLSMDSVNSSCCWASFFLHVNYAFDSVDSTGRDNGISAMQKKQQKNKYK